MECRGHRQHLAVWGWLHSIGMVLHAGECTSLAFATTSYRILNCFTSGVFFFFHVNLQSHNPAKYLLSVKSMWCEQNILRG